MASKLVFVLLLAVGLSQAAKIEVRPEPRDLQLVTLDVIKVVKIIGDKLKSGIEEARPIIIELEGQLNADLAADVHDLLTKLEGIVNEIIARVQVLEKEVTDGIDAINAEAGSCVSQVDKDLDALLDPVEGKLSQLLRAGLEDHADEIDSLTTQIRDLIAQLDAATDSAISNGVACIKKGSKDVKTCLDTNTEAWTGAVKSALVNAALVLNEAIAVIQPIIEQAIADIKPIVDQFLIDADPVWVKFGDCVAKLS